jgi:hypothetical protein
MISAIRIPSDDASNLRAYEFVSDAGANAIARIRSFPAEDKELADLPDRRAYRAMSRASILISAVGLELSPHIAPVIAADPFAVGIYCALNNGPEDYECAHSLRGVSADDFPAQYKRLRNPKHYLKQLPNLAPAQLGIFLGAFGPTNTYTNSRFGVQHAISHAQFDLRTKKIKAAIICSAFAHEDLLLTLRTRQDLGTDDILSEGAAALLITADDQATAFFSKNSNHSRPRGQTSFGIANDLIQLVTKGISQ